MRYEKTPQGLGDTLAGVSHGLGAMLPASILMLRWFLSRRGTAIGICAAGTGFAVVFSSILSALIERFSLRVCFYFEALVSLHAAGHGVPSHPGKARRPAALPRNGHGRRLLRQKNRSSSSTQAAFARQCCIWALS